MLKTMLVLFMLSFLSACLPSSNNSSGPSRIAVISAFGAELEMLLAQVKTPQAHIINGKTFTTGVLRGKQVVLFLSGVSIINATLNTQIAIDYFNISHIVFSGIAGGVNPSLNIGDVTVPTEWANYQKQTFANGNLSDGPWTVRGSETTKFGNFGMAFPQYISITRKNEKPDQLEKKFWFEVDSEMLAVARQVALEVQLERCDSFNRCFTQAPVIYWTQASGQHIVNIRISVGVTSKMAMAMVSMHLTWNPVLSQQLHISTSFHLSPFVQFLT
ncbi:MAG: 5'-methylthioadenosine/S-adenosylhomocysteine nucleosidase [Arenicellales bacterium WSBS_2016_MAG_OTU3]